MYLITGSVPGPEDGVDLEICWAGEGVRVVLVVLVSAHATLFPLRPPKFEVGLGSGEFTAGDSIS
eukprot:CAMPEP_0118667854 /NCGR_PEP_ID=MMETSP0785-20121206/20019_1 /TAXON_ID=91992 /ORGANISM="Bolidomonas pacifica, Strain CCMP 1866" /LENGTH=64 /DNA_ID=CAMNT_0006562357 /DNA_START=751 /DNA_END=945 /DNA_ORIENTATION=-